MFRVEVQMRKKQIGLRLGLRQSHSRFQAAHQRHDVSPLAHIIQDGRHVEIDLRAGRKDRTEVECLRQHANNRHGRATQIDGLSHQGRIAAKLPFPEGMAQKSHRPAVVHAFLSGEQPPQRGLNAQRVKEVSAHHKTGNRSRLVPPDQLKVVGAGESEVARHLLKRMVSLLKLLGSVGRIGHAGFPACGILGQDPYQLLRIWKRQRSQQNRVHYAEDGDVRANSQSQN